MIAMPIAIGGMVMALNLLGSAGSSYQRVENRANAVSSAHVGLERMTRELRQADWVYFRSSQAVDFLAHIRTGGAKTSQPRLVQYRCAGSTCTRLVGAAVGYPPPAGAEVTSTGTMLRNLANQDVFHPQRIDAATGLAYSDFLNPDSVLLRARVAPARDHEKFAGWNVKNPVEIWDGVSLRNNTRFRG